MTASTGRKYDVAISFLSSDSALADRLAEELSRELTVFIYTKRQQEIAGTDGLASLRTPFHAESRLVVVLYRDGWGTTPWTAVEQEAITDRFLKEGPSFLFVLMANKRSTPPPWVPEKLIRLNLEDYPFEQAVGAIKLRAQEAGAALRRESFEERVQRTAALAAFNEETRRLLSNQRGVNEASAEAERLFEQLTALVAAAKSSGPTLGIEVGRGGSALGVRTSHGSLHLLWECRYSNSLEGASLIMRTFQGPIVLPGSNGYLPVEPKQLAREDFRPTRDPQLGWCWIGDIGTPIATNAVADRTMETLLDLALRGSSGGLQGGSTVF